YLGARLLWLPMRGDPVRGLSPSTHAGFVLETLARAALYLLAPFDLSISSSVLTERGGHVAPEAAYVWLGAAVVLLLGLGLLWSARRRRRVFWALLAFSISLLPISNIVWIGGIGLTSPRFFYLPSILLAWSAIELGRGRFSALSPRLALIAGAMGALTLAVLLALQSSVYASATAFWLSELRSRPDVPGNIEFFAERDWRDGNAEQALARSFCEFRLVQERFSFRGEGARIIMKTLEHWAEVTPDSDRARLAAIADFLAAVGQPKGSARLSLEISVELPEQGKVRQRLRRFAAPLLTQEAELRVRVGEPTRAGELIRQARASCPRCDDLLDRQARVAYRAFEPELAEQLAQGTLDATWGGSPKRALLARQKAMNAAIERADGAARAQLLAQRAAEAWLPAEALRLLEGIAAARAAPDIELAKLRLHFAKLAGDAAATQRAAGDLGIAPPALPPGISGERTQRYVDELKTGCAYPKELIE
ncbi:MAG TPA: hypothetical protein VEQ59_13945, partial [Polyangiaceae bacterium]|nr:hypothetical protein [Polyangiaceae bacterium]